MVCLAWSNWWYFTSPGGMLIHLKLPFSISTSLAVNLLQPSHSPGWREVPCESRDNGCILLTLSVLGASPLKKPKAPSSLRIILKQSNMPLYFWTLPNVSLASWNPCIFSSGKKTTTKAKIKIMKYLFHKSKIYIS